jgi:hypothetical protein
MDSTQPGMAAVEGGYLNSKAMIVGLACISVGGVIGAWGIGVSGAALMRSMRRWLKAQQLETVIAKPTTVPAKAASSAGGTAWRKEMATPSPAQ